MSPWHPTPQYVALGPLTLWLMLYQLYNPEALRVKLKSVPTVDRTLGEVKATVRAACDAEGIILCVGRSSRTHDGVSERYDMKKLTCQRGGANRQASYQRSLDAGELVIHGVKTGLSSPRDAAGASLLQARSVGLHCTHRTSTASFRLKYPSRSTWTNMTATQGQLKVRLPL